MTHTVTINSTRRIEARDITAEVAPLVEPEASGLLLLSVPHTTCAISLSEEDPDLLRDMERVAEHLLEPLEPFAHHKNNNPNARAHLMSSMMGTQLLLPVVSGALHLGTYQRIVLLELDGPRERHIEVALLAESRTELASAVQSAVASGLD